MPHDSNIIIVDTSCLILLYKIDKLDLLSKMGQNILVTSVIRNEFEIPSPEWISISDP
jgi:predicted nucleic acid-binding protein